MISDEELAQLPSDPEFAFVKFEEILRHRLYEAEQIASETEQSSESCRLEYMTKISAAAKAYHIDALSDLCAPDIGWRNNFESSYSQFLRSVDHVTMQIRIHATRLNREGSVGLEDINRKKIHHFIDQIREAIGQADLTTDRREALYSKLNNFATEVDKPRTSLQSGMTVYIAVCDAIGQGFEKLEPARKWFDSIAALMGARKTSEDEADVRLPVPSERRRIKPPPKGLPAPPADDDIPF